MLDVDLSQVACTVILLGSTWKGTPRLFTIAQGLAEVRKATVDNVKSRGHPQGIFIPQPAAYLCVSISSGVWNILCLVGSIEVSSRSSSYGMCANRSVVGLFRVAPF